MTSVDWRLRAACRGQDPELWFSDAKRKDARAICAACPVAAACLDAVMRAEHGRGAEWRHGIYAGLSGRQRYRRALSAKARPGPRPEETDQLAVAS